MSVLRVMTYNVRHCRGLDDAVDIPRIAAVIRDAGPHLVALQELDVGFERSGRMDQPDELAKATGLRMYFHPTLERDGGRYGIALATDEPVEVAAIDLPRVGAEEPRCVLMTAWRGFTVLGTHLSRHRRARRAQIELMARMAKDAPGPVLVLGDLNDDHDALGPLRDAGLDGPRLRTHPARRARRQKDHVLASPPGRVVRAATIATHASDHLPVVADLSL